MKKYTYKGQISRFTIDNVDYCLEPGNEYLLPSESPYIRTLVATGALTETVETKEPLKKS